MKTLFLSIIIASIVIGTITSIAFFFNAGNQNPCTYCPEIPTPASESTQSNNLTNTAQANPLGITALVEFVPINMNWDSGPNYHYYLKISSTSTAYLLGYDICGKDLCVKNDTLSILLPITKLQIPNYTQIGVSDTNHTWNYGDTVNMQLEVSPSIDNKTAYFIDIKNSTIVP